MLEGKKQNQKNNNYINNINNLKLKKEGNALNNELDIYDLKLNENNIYKKINNFYSNRNLNNNNHNYIKKREKNIVLINKQKNVSANTSIKNKNISRLLNLIKLKRQNNINTKTLINKNNKK